jgi:hypothetical protein
MTHLSSSAPYVINVNSRVLLGQRHKVQAMGLAQGPSGHEGKQLRTKKKSKLLGRPGAAETAACCVETLNPAPNPSQTKLPCGASMTPGSSLLTTKFQEIVMCILLSRFVWPIP